jgi:DNA-binding GntR family transcriptional regulator
MAVAGLAKVANTGFKTKQDYAYDIIREAIVTGELEPGERLIISSLAVELGISEIPVREALKRLLSEGLIINNGPGLFVAPVSVKEFIDLLSVRLELEGMAVRRAAENIDEMGLKEIDELMARMEEANRLKDWTSYSKLDKELHALIHSYCRVDVLIRAINDAWSLSERGRAIFRLMPLRAETSIKEHREIVAALRSRQGELAERLLISHKKQAFDLFTETLTAQLPPEVKAGRQG